MDETTMLITLAVIFGFIGGALARQPKLRQLASEKAALIEQCGELFIATEYFHQINHRLCQELEAAGLHKTLSIVKCDCEDCDEEWPESLEEVSQ